MRGFRRAQLRGSEELFRPTEEPADSERIAPGLPLDNGPVSAVPSAPAPDVRSVRLTEDQIRTLAEALQHLKFPQKAAVRPSIGDYEQLEELRQKLLDAI